MHIVELDDFDIEQIALSGQCFRINDVGGGCWSIAAFGYRLFVQQDGKRCQFSCSPEEFFEVWSQYFDLQTNYGKVKEKIRQTRDPYLINAVNYGYGIRILRQDLWEMIVSYIISQRNNITRIKKTIEKLCRPFSGNFPTSSELKDFSESDFQKMGMGYRAKYVYDVVRAAESGQLNMNLLRKMAYPDVVKYLKQFNGVGDKVANCIALFALHKTEAFPIDVWIQRIIDTRYHGEFDYQQFGEHAGIVQQYMFFYERYLSKKNPKI